MTSKAVKIQSSVIEKIMEYTGNTISQKIDNIITELGNLRVTQSNLKVTESNPEVTKSNLDFVESSNLKVTETRTQTEVKCSIDYPKIKSIVETAIFDAQKGRL